MIIPVDICNFALSNVGAFAGLQTVETGNSKEATSCRAQYPVALKAVLRDHDWGFARKSASLALLDITPVGYSLAYKYPTGCVRAIRVFNEAVENGTIIESEEQIRLLRKKRIPFEVGSNDAGDMKLILTNKEQAVLIYTAFVDNPNMFDPLFIEALGYKLSAAFVPVFKANINLQSFYLNQYERTLGKASAASANESTLEPDSGSDFEAARI